jgi:hypothetical protein
MSSEKPVSKFAFSNATCTATLRLLGHPAKVGKFAARWEQDDFSSHVMRAQEVEAVVLTSSSTRAPPPQSNKKFAAAAAAAAGTASAPPSKADKEALAGWMAAAAEWKEEARDAFFALDRWLRGSDLCPAEYDLSHITPPTPEEFQALLASYLEARERVDGTNTNGRGGAGAGGGGTTT